MQLVTLTASPTKFDLVSYLLYYMLYMIVPELEIPVDSLIPIQTRGVSLPHLRFLASLAKLHPVDAVLYEGEPDTDIARYLLVDGTHRAYLRYQQGEERVRAHTAIIDEHVPLLDAASIGACWTLDDVHNKYRTLWLPGTATFGITSIDTLPTYPEERYN
jgi:hypothetical protein